MRVKKNPEDIGRCGCGRQEYCDGSHGLTESEWEDLCRHENRPPKVNVINFEKCSPNDFLDQKSKSDTNF